MRKYCLWLLLVILCVLAFLEVSLACTLNAGRTCSGSCDGTCGCTDSEGGFCFSCGCGGRPVPGSSICGGDPICEACLAALKKEAVDCPIRFIRGIGPLKDCIESESIWDVISCLSSITLERICPPCSAFASAAVCAINILAACDPDIFVERQGPIVDSNMTFYGLQLQAQNLLEYENILVETGSFTGWNMMELTLLSFTGQELEDMKAWLNQFRSSIQPSSDMGSLISENEKILLDAIPWYYGNEQDILVDKYNTTVAVAMGLLSSDGLVPGSQYLPVYFLQEKKAQIASISNSIRQFMVTYQNIPEVYDNFFGFMGHYGAIGEGLGGSKPLIMEFDGAFEYGRFNATDFRLKIMKILEESDGIDDIPSRVISIKSVGVCPKNPMSCTRVVIEIESDLTFLGKSYSGNDLVDSIYGAYLNNNQLFVEQGFNNLVMNTNDTGNTQTSGTGTNSVTIPSSTSSSSGSDTSTQEITATSTSPTSNGPTTSSSDDEEENSMSNAVKILANYSYLVVAFLAAV